MRTLPIYRANPHYRSPRRSKNKSARRRIAINKYLYVTRTYIDDHDYEELSNYRWLAKYVHNRLVGVVRYKRFNGKTTCIMMHRELLGLPRTTIKPWQPGEPISDHVDGNPLNNRRTNLRIVNIIQNNSNCFLRNPGRKSRFIGLSKHGESRWKTWIGYHGRSIYLGQFPMTKSGERLAAATYNIASRLLHGEFGVVNKVGRLPRLIVAALESMVSIKLINKGIIPPRLKMADNNQVKI